MMRISNEWQQLNMSELVPLLMNEMQHSIHEVVSPWVNTLTISKTEAESLAMFTTGAVFGAGLLWAQQPDGTQSIDEFADQIMPLLMQGIRGYAD